MPEPTAERLARLLALIAYLQDHPGVRVSEVADHFGVSEAQVVADVNLLWVSGTPGYLPDDLIDFSYDAFERGVLTLTEDRGMARPLRLSASEAIALLAAVRSLADADGLPESAAVTSATAKLAAAAGEAAAAAHAVDVRLARPPAAGLIADLRRAVAEHRVVHLTYVTGADVVGEREVDPVELLTDGARWFLRAWCHRALDVRHFRLDRILDARVREDMADPHPELLAGDGPGVEPDLSAPSIVATLELAPRARWVVESLPVDQVTELPDGWLEVRLRVADPAWLRSLVLGLGPDVRALAPATLARDVADTARAALAAYDGLA